MQNSLKNKKNRKSLTFIFFALSTFPESAPKHTVLYKGHRWISSQVSLVVICRFLWNIHPLSLEMKIKELKMSLIGSSCLFCNVNISRCLPVILSVFYCRLSLCSQDLIHPGQVSNTDKRPSTDATQQVLGIQPTCFCALELPLKNILQGELYLLPFPTEIQI